MLRTFRHSSAEEIGAKSRRCGMEKMIKQIGNLDDKITTYMEEKVAYFLFLSFTCLGFVVGFRVGNVI